MFRPITQFATQEFEIRKQNRGKALRFGVDFLDDATRGIFDEDLILLGAPSGVGKTQLCCNIALANLEDGKRIHYIALEAGEMEIDRRLKFPLVAERYFSDPNRPKLSAKLNYADWLLGEFSGELEIYEQDAAKFFETAYKNFSIHYKGERFGLADLVQAVLYCATETDLILIDHVHFFDLDDDNENRAIKEIAKTVRDLVLSEKKPIVLVAHLRKRNQYNDELIAGQEEFHGSSDLFKIATKVVTVAPGKPTQDGLYETFFRVPKNRIDQGPTKFCAREFFNPKTGGYERGKYQLGWADQKRSKGFEELARDYYPDWAKRSSARSQGFDSASSAQRQSELAQHQTRERRGSWSAAYD